MLKCSNIKFKTDTATNNLYWEYLKCAYLFTDHADTSTQDYRKNLYRNIQSTCKEFNSCLTTRGYVCAVLLTFCSTLIPVQMQTSDARFTRSNFQRKRNLRSVRILFLFFKKAFYWQFVITWMTTHSKSPRNWGTNTSARTS